MPGSTATPAPDGSGGIDNAKEPREFLPDGANPCECSQSGLGLTETPRVTPRQRLPSSPELRGNGFASPAQAGAAMGAIRLLLGERKMGGEQGEPGFGEAHTGSAHAERLFDNKPRFPKHPLTPLQPIPAPKCAFLRGHSSPPELSINNQGQYRCWKHKRLCHEEYETEI